MRPWGLSQQGTGSDGKPTGYSIDLCYEIAFAVQQELKSPSTISKLAQSTVKSTCRQTSHCGGASRAAGA